MKTKFISKSILFGAFISIISLLGCKEKVEFPEHDSFLKVETKSINFEETAGETLLPVKSNGAYVVSVASGGEWCTATVQSGGILLQVTPNDEKDVRKTTLEVSLATFKETIEIAQLGWGKALLLSSYSTEVGAPGGKAKVDVTTNIEYAYKIDGGDGWVISQSGSRSDNHPVVTNTYIFEVLPNDGGIRKAAITFFDKDQDSNFEPVTFSLNQNGIGDYQPGSPEDIKDDIKVKVINGTASSFQSGEGIEKSFDGDINTIYHSDYNNKGDSYFPITLEYNFEKESNMDYFVYYPRSYGSNGLFKEVDIEVKTNANTRGTEEWKKVMTYDFKGNSNAMRVDFQESLIGVSSIRFVVKSGTGDGQGFASCAEMEFYKKNPENFDWSVLFSDPTCSELKPGITEKDILNCKYSVFQNIAYYMFYNKYPKEFRIASFKSYPHPDIQAGINKTGTYSLLDNPTGIAVDAGEDLVVMADLNGQTASLRIQNLDKSGGDGFGGDNYPLANGVNKIRIKNKGLVYVMYHTSDLNSLPDIKLHFVTGKVNGYYDSQNPVLKDRYAELLNNAVDPYFDVVGKYAHLTFPTSRFRNHTKDLKRLIDYYDQIVYNEQMLMGLVKYNKEFKNRMYFNVMYHSYMYSTSYHTGYHDNTLGELCNDENFKSAVWGPAHEVGHSNQTRPGLKWLGTTEVTNNIMSEYIQTTVFGAPSRIQVEDMGNKVASNRYAKAWNGIIVDQLPHASHDDVFCKLVPFWQLELFMGKVNGKTPLEQEDNGGFYPDVYEYIRTNPDFKSPGEQQLEFVYIACKCAQLNLLDFFEKWGFLKEVDIEIDDYGKGRMTINKSQIDDVRSRVEKLGLQKLTIPVEYISDNNYMVFKNKEAIVKGTSNRNGNIITMTDWKNVVVYEVRENKPDGKLIAVSEGVNSPSNVASFEIRNGWKDNYKVYAVQYDNKRVEVSF